eukprot:TRINITY_DN6716_c0_g1_i1.p1 TRINITY_DN6716_c0_g1~~TRINITY_DN6716_c0_g1_i1.p1  ORF type:complete len:101 (+),score=16.35 TRINITY_DN6716_c0_g1_i1:136-438(+)
MCIRDRFKREVQRLFKWAIAPSRCLGKKEKLVLALSHNALSVVERTQHLHLIVHVLLLVELTLILSGGILVLLVLGHKICLLYTSPSPRDRTRSRMPSSA